VFVGREPFAVVPILEIMGASELRERGIAADVFEQAPALTEIGAAIALSANATREYARLGPVDELAAVATIPTELIYRDWRTGERIAAHPVAKDDWYVRRFGAPYHGIHRANLQKTLGTAFGMQNLHLGCRLLDIRRAARRRGAEVRQRPRRARRPRRGCGRRALDRAPLTHRPGGEEVTNTADSAPTPIARLTGDWYSTEELAARLRVDPSSIRRWRTADPPQGPPFVRISARVTVYSASDVETWLRARRVDPERAA
jgi:hypothetical protein